MINFICDTSDWRRLKLHTVNIYNPKNPFRKKKIPNLKNFENKIIAPLRKGGRAPIFTLLSSIYTSSLNLRIIM